MQGHPAISATSVLIQILGSVALLLWGSRMVRTGVMRAFGGDLRLVLGRALRRRLTAFAAGLGVTAILQSSTATALLTASFAERGLMATAPALAVMLGADVGTSLVVQALSFGLDWVAPLLVLGGVVAFMAGRRARWRDLGRAAIGLGLMLIALHQIVAATGPIRQSAVLAAVLRALDDEPVLALAVAAALTWLAHSSVATILLVLSLAAGGILSLPLALALLLGANIGGAVPAVVATWRAEPAGRRLALGNLAFRTAGCLAALPLLDEILPLLLALDPAPARAVANFHTGLNLALAAALLPDRPRADDPAAPRYLDPSALDTPPLAIAAAARETLRMGDAVERMLRDSLAVLAHDDRALLAEVSRRDDVVDKLHEAIKLYLTRLNSQMLSEAESRRVMEIIAFTTNLEHVGDIVDKGLMDLAARKIKGRLQFSEDGLRDIAELHRQVMENFSMAMAVFMSGDLGMARRLLEEKAALRERERAAAEQHLERLRRGRAESIETSSIHLDVLGNLRRINSHVTSAAYPILERAGELRASRLRSAGA